MTTARLAIVCGAALLAGPLAGGEWSQWRGPRRDGAASADSVPASWPAAVRRAWRVEVGEGYSSPVTAHGRVFVHGRRDPDEVVTAVDLGTGRIVWQQQYAASFAKNQY